MHTSTPSRIVIREGVAADASATAALLAPIVAAGIHTAIEGPVDEATQRAFIESLPARALFLVAEERAPGAPPRVVGMQDVLPASDQDATSGDAGAISTFVALDRHRRGIAARLFTETYRRARALGYRRLVAVVRADNAAGLRAYRGQGFRLPDSPVLRGAGSNRVVLERTL